MPFSTCCRLIVGLFVCIHTSLVSAQNQPIDTLQRIADDERRRLIDPALDTIPYERLETARKQLQKRPVAQTNSAIPNVTWQERGPNNIGGKTRTLLFDLNDPNRKKVWAGSIIGGLWYTNDITDANATWTPVSDDWESKVITALAADPSNPQVMYAGTGDVYDGLAGSGIWKTTNGGTTWTRLSSSIPGGTFPSVTQALAYIQRIVVSNTGKVFVATRYGVVQSSDGGTSWSYALAPGQLIGVGGISGNYSNDNVTDLEISSDGILYAGFNPSRVFKSNDATGTTWTEITPPGASGGGRTELALALSTSGTSQVLYGASYAYNSTNYGQDLRWFKKSINGGATWTDMAVPMYTSTTFFTNGNGHYGMALAVNPTNPNTVYAGGTNWYRSTNGGTSWGSTLLASNYTPYQHLLLMQPNGVGAVFSSNQGVNWSANWGDNNTITPTVIDRNTGYRTSSFYSVAMKATAGNAYLIGGTASAGTVKVPNPNLSAGSVVANSNFDAGVVFIDEEDPTIQIVSAYFGEYYRYNGSSSTYIGWSGGTSNNPADYDSQSKTLYAYSYSTNGAIIRKFTGIGDTISTTDLSISSINNTPSFFKLSPDKQSLFVGTYGGQIYKVTNLNQSTPTVTSLSNNTYLQNAVVSCIDVGVDDNELLVTYSNYGVKSVWYTATNGNLWISKDETGYGLPDIPVRYALFNPQNRLQVLLATELGVWSTTNITASNPGWESTSIGLGNFRVNVLKYRRSDGRVAAATFGRGLFTTDAFAIPYTLPSVALTGVSNATLCAGNTFNVSFTTSGPGFGNGNKFDVWLSDSNGNFTNALKIGSGTTSPVSATLPSGSNALPYGTNYRVKIISTNPEVESTVSNALAIGNLMAVYILDRRYESVSGYFAGGVICPGGSARMNISSSNYGYTPPLVDSSQWFQNGNLITGATNSSYIAQQAGNYTVTVKQAGCTITSQAYIISTSSSISSSILALFSDIPQCADQVTTIMSNYIGETASFQWTRNGVDIPGATEYRYKTNQTGSYNVRMVDGNCNFSIPSSLYLQFSQSIVATAYANDPFICSGSGQGTSVSTNLLEIPNIYSTTPKGYSIQWYHNGTAITQLAPLTSSNNSYYAYQAGIYSYLLKQGNCQTRSNGVVITETTSLSVGISSSYKTKTACPGEVYYLYSTISSGNLQWQKDGIDIPGATNYMYTVTSSGKYTLRLTKGNCSAVSPPVSFTYSNAIQPKVILNSSVDKSCSGISLSSDTYSNYQHQWYRNGTLMSGYTSYFLYAHQPGAYSVRVTNGNCTGISKEVYVDPNSGQTTKPQVVLAVETATPQLCSNNGVRLLAKGYVGAIRWKLNGNILPNVGTNYLYATQAGLYTAITQDGSCQAESDPIEIKIGEPTTAALSGNALVSAGQSAQLAVAFTGPAPWAFTLTNGQSVTATYQNPHLISVSPTATTTYQLANVANACGLGATSGQANVTVGTGSADVSLGMAVSNKASKVGDMITYTLAATNAGPTNAQGVQVSSILPAGLSYVGSSSPGVSFANGIVSANLGTINASTKSAISFNVSPTQPGTFATSAQVTSSQTPDPDSQPNSGTGDGQDDVATIEVRTTEDGSLIASANPNQVPLPVVSGNQPGTDANTADLNLSMKADKLTATTSELVTTFLTVSNRGGAAAASVVVQVVLPNGTFSPQSPAGWIQVNSQTYKLYINTLDARKSATISLKWQPAGTGTIQAQILDTDVADPDSTPGNGYQNGEDDEAAVLVRVL